MQEIRPNLVPVPATELLRKCKKKEDLINICRELGKFNNIWYYPIGYYFPKEKGFDGRFFLQWGCGQKKVKHIIYLLYSYLNSVKLEDILSDISLKIIILQKSI